MNLWFVLIGDQSYGDQFSPYLTHMANYQEMEETSHRGDRADFVHRTFVQGTLYTPKRISV